MALMHTPLVDPSFKAPDFALKGVDGKTYSYADIKGDKATLVLFICNHCPYVKAIIERLVEDVKTLQKNGVGVVAIMPNDTVNYPDDSFENMKVFAQTNGFTFPYVIDETQNVAKAYDAICTPDVFGFNADDQLRYRGRIDSSGREKASGETAREMLDAMLHIAETGEGPKEQTPSMGCSIKWKSAEAA